MPTDPSRTAMQLGEIHLSGAHHAQWQAAELCYQWLVEWEDAEVRERWQLARLRRHLEVMARGIQTAVAEVERLEREVRMP